ncbi:MAG: hypothetical protein LBT37_03430 [Lactobacillaceae bacterium]|jgi:predicted peptidase|nr:hypothetical protein [Lactobacillaceae bacterium]
MKKKTILISILAGVLVLALILTAFITMKPTPNISSSSSKKASTSSTAASSSAATSSSFTKTNTDDPTEDPALATVLSEVQSKYQKLSYTDDATGVTLNYYLYVPENYDKNTKYPLISFIHDDSVTGKGMENALTQGYGGVIWATEAEQKKHASFVLVPYFETSTIAGGAGQSGSEVVEAQVQTYYDLLQKLQKEYSIDADRLYQTGQSMGGMTAFYLNSKYPDLFAATLYVSSQWDVNQLKPLENQKFFYIVSGADKTASGGQTDLMNLFNTDGITYSTAQWDPTADAATKNTVANEMINKNTNQNFVQWSGNLSHNESFDYGYTVPAVRDWLFNQSKAN